MKEAYSEQTANLVYKDKELILLGESERLLIKGFEQICRSNKDCLSNENR